MTAAVPYFNGVLTLMETTFNVLGYLPKEQFPRLNEWPTSWRLRYGGAQALMGVALFALGIVADCFQRQASPARYLSRCEQMMSLGLLYANHGVFNIIRSQIEKNNWGGRVTLAYDFYGRKVLPPLSPRFDWQTHLFERIRDMVDRIQFATFFPPGISFRRS